MLHVAVCQVPDSFIKCLIARVHSLGQHRSEAAPGTFTLTDDRVQSHIAFELPRPRYIVCSQLSVAKLSQLNLVVA